MPDTPFEMPQGSGQKPHLSEDTLSHYRETLSNYERMLADPDLHPAMREYIGKMQQQIRDGVALTGQKLEPVDNRSPAQVLYDQRMGQEPRTQADYFDVVNSVPVGYQPPEGSTTSQVVDGMREFAAALGASLPLAKGLTDDLLSHQGKETDKAQIAEKLEAMGHKVEQVLKDAQHAISFAQQKMGKQFGWTVNTLPLYSLLQLSILGRHLKTWQASRPQ